METEIYFRNINSHKTIFKILKEEPKNLIGDISKMKEMLTTPVTSINSGVSSLLSK